MLCLSQIKLAFLRNQILSPNGTEPCILPVILSMCVCVCDPLTSEPIVIELAHTNPSPFAGPLQSPCHRSSLPLLKQQQPFSCCLASPQARSSQSVQPQARPHNWRSVSVYSPFCPLSPLPLDDQALQPIPRERTSIMVKRLLQLAKQNGTRTCFLQKLMQTDVCATSSQQTSGLLVGLFTVIWNTALA